MRRLLCLCDSVAIVLCSVSAIAKLNSAGFLENPRMNHRNPSDGHYLTTKVMLPCYEVGNFPGGQSVYRIASRTRTKGACLKGSGTLETPPATSLVFCGTNCAVRYPLRTVCGPDFLAFSCRVIVAVSLSSLLPSPTAVATTRHGYQRTP